MCIGQDYALQEAEAMTDRRFDRVIGSIMSGRCRVETRVGTNVMSALFVKEDGRWTTKGRSLRQIPKIKH